ncbi:hypothetical protein H0H92_005668 [Tricholoma furcatifolium]|nr:hypothetical protein H0H92_005668 [Tricholoma furcatifolium]
MSDTGIVEPPCHLEMDTGNMVRIHTNIPVPRYHRIVKPASCPKRTIILSRYVPGRTLAQCWDEFGFLMQFRIALTLRYYIRQLRTMTSSVPGPVGDGPQVCYGTHFTEYGSGPFPSYIELSAFYAEKLETTRRIAELTNRRTPDLTLFDNSLPLVMTHQDLNERNIILGDDGQLWIVDWQRAGYYPEWFEYCSVLRCHGQYFPGRGRPDLRRFVELMAGKYDGAGQILFYRTIYRVLAFNLSC